MKTVRIGSGAGYAGDRIEPAVELMEKGCLDYIIFECLAERTIALGQQDRIHDPDKGYNQLLEMRMERILPIAKEKRIKVITNMGAANPLAAMKKSMEIAGRIGVQGLTFAAVTGDDITDQMQNMKDHEVLEFEGTLNDLDNEILSMNVYMGCEGIVEALGAGADIIITGRVSDPALTIGPLIYEFGWNVKDHPDQMGQAVLAGHLLECAGQVTGGYYADPGYKDVPDLERLGFPLAEVDETGKIILTKVKGSGGLVTVDTCKEQMIYEIHNPARYLTPDAIADFSHVTFTQIGEDRVLAVGATSHDRPETLKVSVGYNDCYIGEGEISYGGSNAMARAKLAAEIVEKRLRLTGVRTEELRCDFIGYNSLYRDRISQNLLKADIPEVRLRVSGRTKERKDAVLIANEIETLYTNGPAGGGGVGKRVEEVVSICSVFVSRDTVQANVTYNEI